MVMVVIPVGAMHLRISDATGNYLGKTAVESTFDLFWNKSEIVTTVCIDLTKEFDRVRLMRKRPSRFLVHLVYAFNLPRNVLSNCSTFCIGIVKYDDRVLTFRIQLAIMDTAPWAIAWNNNRRFFLIEELFAWFWYSM